MPVYKFWAKAAYRLRCKFRHNHPFDGTIEKWGGSDRSIEDAERVATRLVEKLAVRVEAEQGFTEYDLYNTGPGLREKVIMELPAATPGSPPIAMVTRNRYGAEVLNAYRVAFVDIDDPFFHPPPVPMGTAILQFLGLRPRAVVAPPTIDMSNPPESVLRFARCNPSWGLRIYRTAAGWRILVTHALFDPDHGPLLDAMKSMEADPLYIRLCRGQKLFRARLTPKPWRVGCRNPEGEFPFTNPEKARGQEAWLMRYDKARQGHAVCQFHSHLGPDRVGHSDIAEILDFHDRRCIGDGAHPLA